MSTRAMKEPVVQAKYWRRRHVAERFALSLSEVDRHLARYRETRDPEQGLRHRKMQGRSGRKGACFILPADAEAYFDLVLVDEGGAR